LSSLTENVIKVDILTTYFDFNENSFFSLWKIVLLQPLSERSTHNLKHSITDPTFAKSEDKFGFSFLFNLNEKGLAFSCFLSVYF